MATSYHEGMIGHILIQNIGKFKGCHKLDLTSDNRIVTLVGDSATGKKTLLNAIGHTHYLKLAYTVIKDENDNTCLNIDSAEKQEDQNGSTKAGENEIVPNMIDKFNASEESLLMIETSDAKGYPVYYGLYSGEDEDSWYWHHEQKDGSYRYSTMFFYSHQDGKLYLLSPQKTMTRGVTDKLIEEFQVQLQDRGQWDSLHSEICKCLGKLCEHMLNGLPNDKANLLPSRVKDFPRTSSKEIIQYVKAQQSHCLLLQNPVQGIGDSNRDELMRKLRRTNKQIILTNTTENALRHSLIIRHWKTTGTWLVCRINNENSFLRECKKLRFSAINILCSHVSFLAEGESDIKVLLALFDQWETITENLKVHIECVDGKKNFPSAASFFLKHAYLGLTHLIVCDGDCLTGGSCRDVGKNRAKPLTQADYDSCPCAINIRDSADMGAAAEVKGKNKKHQCNNNNKNCHCPDGQKGCHSVIVCDGKGVLRKCIERIRDKWVGLLYKGLGDGLDDHSCHAELSSTVMFKYLSSITNEPKAEHLWGFSESFLHTFVWNKGDNFDLESALNLPSTEDTKKALAEPANDLASKTVETNLSEQNEELERLYSFINAYFTQYIKYFTNFTLNNRNN